MLMKEVSGKLQESPLNWIYTSQIKSALLVSLKKRSMWPLAFYLMTIYVASCLLKYESWQVAGLYHQ